MSNQDPPITKEEEFHTFIKNRLAELPYYSADYTNRCRAAKYLSKALLSRYEVERKDK